MREDQGRPRPAPDPAAFGTAPAMRALRQVEALGDDKIRFAGLVRPDRRAPHAVYYHGPAARGGVVLGDELARRIRVFAFRARAQSLDRRVRRAREQRGVRHRRRRWGGGGGRAREQSDHAAHPCGHRRRHAAVSAPHPPGRRASVRAHRRANHGLAHPIRAGRRASEPGASVAHRVRATAPSVIDRARAATSRGLRAGAASGSASQHSTQHFEAWRADLCLPPAAASPRLSSIGEEEQKSSFAREGNLRQRTCPDP